MATQQPQPSSSAMAQESSPNYVDTPLLLSYKIPLRVRLRSAISTVARFFGIMTEETQLHTPEFAIIGSGQRTVDTYRENLLGLYTKPKHRDLRFDHWKLTELRTYKEEDSKVKHEFLLATFTDSDKGKVHLRIERRIQDSSVKYFWNKISNSPSDSDAGRQAGAKPKGRRRGLVTKFAYDDVSLVPDRELVQAEQDNSNTNLPVDHLTFGSPQMNLPQFILLTCAIGDCSATYNIMTKNCYWFCYTAAGALKLRFPQFQSIPTRGKGKKGTWHGVPTGGLFKDVNLEDLLATVDTKYEDFKNEIDDIINNPDNRHTKEARKRAAKAEEGQRRAEEERQRAEEEKRRAEEEKRRAEEQNERAEEEKKVLERRAEEEKKRAEEEKRRAEEEKKRAEEEKKRAEEEKKRAEEEKRRAEEAERRIAELEAKLAAQAKIT